MSLRAPPGGVIVQLAAVALSIAAATTGRADVEEAPVLAAQRFSAAIVNHPQGPDIDSYEELFVAGERITIMVSAPSSSALQPKLTLIAPGGTVLEQGDGLPTRITRRGASVSVRNLTLTESGRFVVRVSGVNDTEGAYTLMVRARPPRPVRVRSTPLGDTEPEQLQFPFGAAPGFSLTLTLSSSRRRDPARLDAIKDGVGADAAGVSGLVVDTALTRGSRTRIRREELRSAAGEHRVLVSVAPGTRNKVTLVISVRPPRRARGRVTLDPDLDPLLVPRASPHAGKEGDALRLLGRGFPRSMEAAVSFAVLFDDVPATITGVDASAGGFLDVTVPPPPAPGALVAVTVRNDDRRSACRTDYFQFAEQFTDVTATTVPDLGVLDDLTARRGALADLDGDGNADDVVLVSRDDLTALDIDRLSAPMTVTVVPSVGTVAPFDINPETEIEVFEFTLTEAALVRIETIMDGTLDSSETRLFGPGDPAEWLDRGYRPRGQSDGSRINQLLRPGLYFIEVQADDFEFHGTYSLEVTARMGAGFAPGTRAERTRLLYGDASGALTDVTATRAPAAGSAGGDWSRDQWAASAVAVGDIDGGNGLDLVLAGRTPTATFEHYSYSRYRTFRYRTYARVPSVRVLENDGTGTFALDPAIQPPGFDDRPDVLGQDTYALDHVLLRWYGSDTRIDISNPDRNPDDDDELPRIARDVAKQRVPQAIAVGDIDDDGDLDVVVGFSDGAQATTFVDLAYVDFTQSPPYVPSSAMLPEDDYGLVALSGTEILENRIGDGGGLAYVTGTSMPTVNVGHYVYEDGLELREPPVAPGLHARDLALGDIDGDTDLDLVVSWDEPTTVSVYGRYARYAPVYVSDHAGGGSEGFQTGFVADEPRVATQVLLNDGAGRFALATETWLPMGAGDEFWQANRNALVDLDGDEDLDLVLLHTDGLGSGPGGAATPVPFSPTEGTLTPGELVFGQEDKFDFTITETGLYRLRGDPGTLPWMTLILYGPDAPTSTLRQTRKEYDTDVRTIFAVLVPGAYVVQPWVSSLSGTYTLTIDRLGDPDVTTPSPHTRHALRVMENRGAGTGFVDVTTTVLPPIDAATNDDCRGNALLVHDVNGDGVPDIVVGTQEPLVDATQQPLRSTRVLLGSEAFTFAWADEAFVPGVQVDSGEASDLLLGDVGGDSRLLLLSEGLPRTSPGGTHLRHRTR